MLTRPLHVETRLRYKRLPAATFYPCPDHPAADSLLVTSTTRKWSGEGEERQNLPSTIHEHTPVCIECFRPLLEEDADGGTPDDAG